MRELESEQFACPLCQDILVEGPNGEAYWCQSHFKPFSREDVERPQKWRSMSWSDRLQQIRHLGEAVKDYYRLSDQDVAEVLAFENDQSAEILFTGDVAPDKIALINLAKGLSDTGALLEIIDNATDCSQRKRNGAHISVHIEMNSAKGFVKVTDDAGGMTEQEMFSCMKLGSHTSDDMAERVMGQFGVGAKEAIYHFGREVVIRSSDLHSPNGLEMFVPAEWLEHSDWKVTLRKADVAAGTSSFKIGVLDHVDFDRERIASDLYNTYGKRIQEGLLDLSIDGEALPEIPDAVKLFPPELYPRRYRFYISKVGVEVTISLLEDEPTASGIFFYAFGRRYAHWTWSDPLANALIPKFPQHRLNSHARLDVDFQGRIEDIPINSNKNQVVTSRPMFRTLSKICAKLAGPYLSTISWLSKDNNMRYIQNFAGRSKAHASILSNSPGLDEAIELGSVYESMTLGKPRIADYAAMQNMIRHERSATVTGQSDTTELAMTMPTDSDTAKGAERVPNVVSDASQASSPALKGRPAADSD